jgi:glycosyltransferase involved in cell wall biosynthesis
VHLADAITTNSQAGVTFWASRLGLAPSKIRLIYNGVDTTAFRPREQGREASRGPIVIGNLGRLHHKSGQRHLLAALQRLASDASLPPWRCVIAGDGPEGRSLAELAGRLGLSSRVEFVGHEDAPDRFLQSLDIYVQSSIAEGMPNAVLEAMATGLPVVATAVGGTPEVVEDGVTGWLTPSGDDAAIARYVTRLATDPAERAAMGRAGRLRVESRFSLLRMVEQTENLLDEVTGPAHGGVRGTR